MEHGGSTKANASVGSNRQAWFSSRGSKKSSPILQVQLLAKHRDLPFFVFAQVGLFFELVDVVGEDFLVFRGGVFQSLLLRFLEFDSFLFELDFLNPGKTDHDDSQNEKQKQ